MRGSLDQPPIVLRGNRLRYGLLVLGAGVFVAMGAALLGDPQSRVIGILCMGFFGLCGLMGVAMLVVPPRLEIGPDGFTQKVLWRTTRNRWGEVYGFRALRTGGRQALVGFDYLGAKAQARGTAYRSAMTGAQGSLLSSWEIKPQALAELLNQARERWLTEPAGAPAAAMAVGAGGGAGLSLAGLFGGARLNRASYWLGVAIVVALAVGLGLALHGAKGVSSVSTLFLIRIFAGRLHDIGRSAWWQAVLYAFQAVVFVGAAAMGHVPVLEVAGIAVLVQLVFMIGLGLIPGTRGPNRFGPAPGDPSPLAQAETFR